MKRPIKFRGRDQYGELHYGFFYVDTCGLPCIAEGHGGKLIPVDEDSVAQLVGYDRDGREVYEGDTLVDPKNDKEYEARLCYIAHNPFGIRDDFYKLKLKEATT